MSLDKVALTSYMSRIRKIPSLMADEECELIQKWKEKGEKKALDRLVASHLKLVAKVARGYSGYGLSEADLIAEGNIGIMHAVQHFDPSIGYRFSTYAVWWIKAKMQSFIYNSWSIVKLGNSNNYRKLFFGLNKIKRMLGISEVSDENAEVIAKKMNVKTEEVINSHIRLTSKDFSVNTQINDDSATSWQDFLEDKKILPSEEIAQKQEHEYRKKILHEALNTLSKREYDIICAYRLSSPTKSLNEIGKQMNLSAERVRQIDKAAFLKIQKYVRNVEWSENAKFFRQLSIGFINLMIFG